jgi:hypothetical protein
MDGSRGGGDLGSHVLSLFHRGRLELAIAPSTVRVARHWTARLLSSPVSTSGQASLDAEIVDAAVLAVSELVTNAVRAVSQAKPANVILPQELLAVGGPVAFGVAHGRPEEPATPAATRAASTLTPIPPSVSLVVSRFADVVRIDVHDSSPLPVPPGRDHDADDENGRGLAVVAALASRWGWRPEPFGKVVWCELAVTPGHPGPDCGG